jgi:methyl-accepting chemotaxis protein
MPYLTRSRSVAAAAEQLTNSIREIGERVADSARIATEATAAINAAGDKMQKLSAAAQQIGTIVGLITDIAGQTNLLALNATIEAAPAGDAGRGFALVAQEVKSLAEQTARATTDIAAQISDTQQSTTDSTIAVFTFLTLKLLTLVKEESQPDEGNAD